jgi:SOS-response transcriptional repressor LexA
MTIINTKGFPPTLSEIGRHMGFGNLGSVFCILRSLEKKGYIVKPKGKHRGIELTELVKRKISPRSRKSSVFYTLHHY